MSCTGRITTRAVGSKAAGSRSADSATSSAASGTIQLPCQRRFQANRARRWPSRPSLSQSNASTTVSTTRKCGGRTPRAPPRPVRLGARRAGLTASRARAPGADSPVARPRRSRCGRAGATPPTPRLCARSPEARRSHAPSRAAVRDAAHPRTSTPHEVRRRYPRACQSDIGVKRQPARAMIDVTQHHHARCRPVRGVGGERGRAPVMSTVVNRTSQFAVKIVQ